MKNILRMALLCGSLLCGAPPLLAAGALAIDTNQGDQWGWAIDHASEADARQRALRECGSGCRIVMTFSGACAAYAADQANASTAYGWAWGQPDAGSARNAALAGCRQRGGFGANCIVRVWGCDTAG